MAAGCGRADGRAGGCDATPAIDQIASLAADRRRRGCCCRCWSMLREDDSGPLGRATTLSLRRIVTAARSRLSRFRSLPASGCVCRVYRKLVFRKYDPVVKKHVLFEESKMR